jgi:hypothetical protein
MMPTGRHFATAPPLADKDLSHDMCGSRAMLKIAFVDSFPTLIDALP